MGGYHDENGTGGDEWGDVLGAVIIALSVIVFVGLIVKAFS